MMFSESSNDRHCRIGAAADHLRDRNNAIGIGENSAEIGNNSTEIGNGAAGIVDIAAKLIPC